MAENSSSETQTQAQVEIKPIETIQDVSKEEQVKLSSLQNKSILKTPSLFYNTGHSPKRK